MFPLPKAQRPCTVRFTRKGNQTRSFSLSRKLDISSSLLNCAATELTPFEKVKLQLLHALLSKRNNIVIEDTFDELSILEIQELLHLLSYLAHEENQGILLFTHDATIAQSPYIDRLEPAG